MRVISTRTHGALDYLTGAGLLAAPALLGNLRRARRGAGPQSWRQRSVRARWLPCSHPDRTYRTTRCDGNGGEGRRTFIRDPAEVRAWRNEYNGANRRMMQTSVRAAYQRVLSRKEPFLCLP
jgi:hypothetical protein